MTELGGASTQAGIHYQNSVAALFLADLLELDPAPPRERVISVRVEAPTDVDDIVIEHADGHRNYVSAKLSLRVGDEPWITLWRRVTAQVTTFGNLSEDRVTLMFAEASATVRDLKQLCERAATSVDAMELAGRLTSSQTELVTRIDGSCADGDARLQLLQRIDVRVLSEHEILQELARRPLWRGGAPSATILSVLRDIAGGHARVRATFRAPALRRMLGEEHRIHISEPSEWGLHAYRDAVERGAQIEVPGTSLSGPASEMFVWPRFCDWQRPHPSDFEDELALEHSGSGQPTLDLQTFPSDQLRRCVVVAGPGYGKSALLSALVARLIKGPIVPVTVPLSSLAASRATIQEFLNEHINREYDVRIDWRRLAEQGLIALLLDGLDEVPTVDRAPVLDRLRTFTTRYRQVPWLLTVRDPAALTGAIDARTIEILPLEDSEVTKFATTMALHCPNLHAQDLISRLDRYPDLKRFTRIPLFLAILLATIRGGDEIPVSRAELIERYLRTLFAPHEHKSTASRAVSSSLLRSIAARLAFERLERNEIGASEREIRSVVTAVAQPDDVEYLQAALLEYGILRRQSTIRFQFPFPIVQEYLAATYLVEHAADTLSGRIDDAIERPWAQVLQFALELHPAPAPIIREILGRPDDAFVTGLRLVARCVVNGADVDDFLRVDIGDRLVRYWTHAHFFARERAGQLIMDGFSHPLSPVLRQALHNHWLLHSSGADIVARENDRALTLSILDSLLERPIDRSNYFAGLTPAIAAIGNEAFERILRVAREADLLADEIAGLNSLLNHLEPKNVTRIHALDAANDGRLPPALRLNCFRIAGSPLVAEADHLLLEMVRAEDDGPASFATEIISLASEPETYFLRILADTSIPLVNRFNLAANVTSIFREAAKRDRVIELCLEDQALPAEISAAIMLHAARHGNHAIFQRLIEELPRLDLRIASQAISLFGHHPGRALAEKAAALTEARVTGPQEAAYLSGAVVTGMLYIYEMDYGFAGALIDSQPHAGTSRWMQLLDTWSDRDDLNETDRIQVLTSAARLGSERAQHRLHAMILSIVDADDPRYYLGDDYGFTLRAAIDEVQRRCLLPIVVGKLLAMAKRFNVAHEGISAIAMHSSRAALDLLLTLHAEVTDWHLKDTIESMIETLSAKLGAFIQRDGSALRIAVPTADP